MKPGTIFCLFLEANGVPQPRMDSIECAALASFLTVLLDILRVLELSWRLYAPGWGQMRAHGSVGALLGDLGAQLERKW